MTSPPIEIVFVVAVAENGVIGQDNAIPWKIRSDMQRFRALTLNKPVVMGRKTFESLPKPLVKRTNIVITRDPSYTAEGAVVTASIDAALDIARGDAMRRFATEICVIGGAEIYRQSLHLADRLEVTEVHAQPAGSARFDAVDPAAFEEVARVRHAAGPDDSADFSYVTWRRRTAATDERRARRDNALH